MFCGISPAGSQSIKKTGRIKIIAGSTSKKQKKRILNIFIIKEKSKRRGTFSFILYSSMLVMNILMKRSFRVQSTAVDENLEELNEYIINLNKMKAGRYIILASIFGQKKSMTSDNFGLVELGRISIK
jgi:mannitol-1-phosphate/altronate dehydrogenase